MRPPWMGDAPGHQVAVLSRSWSDPGDEEAFIARQLAGALSRRSQVWVAVPGLPGTAAADGAFDAVGIGSSNGGWPSADTAVWPGNLDPRAVVIDQGDGAARAVVERHAPGAAVLDAADVATRTGVHVAVNPLAAVRRHNALGFTSYVLVLSDRVGPQDPGGRPTPAAAWLTARFARRHVVVVENATASVWLARSLRGVVGVDTRTDLWRLVAHAGVVVDLAPGPVVARECVEALRFGTPIVVPAGTAAADLAAAGGGLWFTDVAELLGCVAACGDPAVGDALGAQGRRVADERYGDAQRVVAQVGAVLSEVVDR